MNVPAELQAEAFEVLPDLGNPMPLLMTMKQSMASRHLYQMFPNMQDKIPAGSKGGVVFKHVQHSASEAYVVGALRNELRTTDPMVQMDIDGVGWMFDTLHEKWMNRTTVIHARGDVLLGGLGMGMILWPILAKRSVRTVTVIENNQDVVDYILPTLAAAKGIDKLQVVMADAREYEPEPGQLFDYIWLDCVPAYGYGLVMLQVHDGWMNRYQRFHRLGGAANLDGWMLDHWGYQENLLYLLHGSSGTEQHEWPREDRRPYPIGPPDPAVALLADKYDQLGHKDIPRAELMRMMAVAR